MRSLGVIYSVDLLADAGQSLSPSSRKPAILAGALLEKAWPIRIVEPVPMPTEAIYRVHDRGFVDSILSLERENGFGTLSETVAKSLTYTCGAFHTGALLALQDGLAASLTSGFHHAGTARARGFCTFNGLMISAVRLLDSGAAPRVAILDCDFHYGDGTAEMVDTLGLKDRILHASLGERAYERGQAGLYLRALRDALDAIEGFNPGIVLYQAGVDSHVNDPLGGLLTTDEMRERDATVFRRVTQLGIPLTWNLAGGYQVEPDGTIPKVIALHLNTFQEALMAKGLLRPMTNVEDGI
jgi:acetoin utilization deacetylase AcuC-like enzyme